MVIKNIEYKYTNWTHGHTLGEGSRGVYVHTNSGKYKICARCRLPEHKLTTHCPGAVIDAINKFHLDRNEIDFVEGLWVVKND